MLVGGFLDVIVALACIGTAVTLYPVVKRQNEGVALGFVAARVLEASMIFAGVVSLLSLVTLRQDLGAAAGADAASLVTTGASHVAIYNWTFLLGQSLMPAINALLLGSLMYRSRLVPRLIPVMGLIGAPLLIAAVIATLFTAHVHAVTGVSALAALPVAAWDYIGFAIADGRPTIVATEAGVAALFVVIAAAAVTGPAWLLVSGFTGHGLKDLWQHRHHYVANTRWWPPFCLVVDWVAAAILVLLIATGIHFHH